LVVGLLGGGAVVAKAMSNYEDAVKSLARAPVGCTTTLVFASASTFTVYVETKGQLSELPGNCGAATTAYSHPGDKLPKFSLTLVNNNGDEIEMPEATGASYDVAGYVGTQARSLKITEAGSYRLNVVSDDKDFAISIGKNPKDDYDLLTVIGGGLALAGLIFGVLFVLLGLRRRKPVPVIVDPRNPIGPLPDWPPSPYATAMPPTPPTFPGYGPQPPPPIQQPGPPIRLAEQPSSGGFAPPAFAPPPPPPPSGTMPSPPPVAGMPPAPPSVPQPDEDELSAPTLPDARWTIQEKPKDDG
jgi:hypothetical protein